MSREPERRKPILLVDFDGVIHSYTSGWKGADVIPDPPVDGAFEFLSEASEKFDVQVYSSRSGQEGGIEAMGEWFQAHGWPCSLSATGFNKPEGLKFPTEKPPAFLTIDDRAFCFEGEWPRVESLVSFKPWHKRGES